MRWYLPAIFFVFSFSVSCNGGITKQEITQNDKIDPKVKKELDNTTQQIYTYLKENNYEPLSQLFSDTLQQRVGPEFSQKFMPQIQKVIRGRAFRIFDEYYIRNGNNKDTVKFSSGKGDGAYSVKMMTLAPETFISFIVSGDSLNEVMITLIYVKEKGKWKVDNLMGEDYSLNNKNATQQYRLAQQLTQNNNLMDAVNVMALATHCLYPAGGLIKFKEGNHLTSFSDSLGSSVKALFPFPYTVTAVSTQPKVFNIHYEVVNHKLAPMIMYLSDIDVKDTVALGKENEQMQQHIGSTFPGMNKNNETLLYRAYNIMPNGQNDPRYYGYIRKQEHL